MPRPANQLRGFQWRLRDGTPVRLAPVLPEDRQRIEVGFEELSRGSRYLRFFSGIDRLSEAQLDYLSRCDQVNHVAWGAMDPTRPHWPGVGLGRFHRDPQRPDVAEFAVVVADPLQGRGLGSTLLAVLYARALALGVKRLRANVLKENVTVFDWLLNLGATITCGPEQCELTLEVRKDLPADPSSVARFAALVKEIAPLLPHEK